MSDGPTASELEWLRDAIAEHKLWHASHKDDVVPYVAAMTGDIADRATWKELARDPMPVIVLKGGASPKMQGVAGAVARARGEDDREATNMLQSDLPGPRCLRAFADTLGLTDDQRALYRMREEDAAALLEERVKWLRESTQIGLTGAGLSALLADAGDRAKLAAAARRKFGASPFVR